MKTPASAPRSISARPAPASSCWRKAAGAMATCWPAIGRTRATTTRWSARTMARPRRPRPPAGYEAGSAAARNEKTLARHAGKPGFAGRARQRASERNVVVHVGQVGRAARGGSRRRGRTLRGGPLRRRALLARRVVVTAAAVAAPALAAAVAAAQHLHLVGDDLGAVAVGAGFLVLPLAGLQAALDIDRTAFLQVFAGDLGQAVVHDHPVPLGFFATLAGGLVLPLGGGGDGDVADRRAVGAVAHFGVAPQVADENDFIDRCHGEIPLVAGPPVR